ncbi:hypothetical protein F4801DRAFT_182071 [Xylaria longipes]|nr:hypothetical protein F4801DRAFT_182071 [Xylaria longipes]RYC63602.1 hypothetical protein CHU98_g2610 [Xylaria longipes]
MLHLRFHRRTPSNPTSPELDRASWDTAALQPAHLVPTDGVPAPDVRPRSDTSLPFAQVQGQPLARTQAQAQPRRDDNPPVLPPIARVVSADSQSVYSQDSTQGSDQKLRDDPKPPPQSRSPYNEQSGFIGGLALENYSRESVALNQPVPQASASPASTGALFTAVGSKPPAPAKTSRTTSSFVSPTDLQNVLPTGKRPPGARMASDPPAASNPPVARDLSKAKKGLPFLKNPMSTLLLRRKTSQSIPDLSLPLRERAEEPVYDPRIRGTVVHDFSAPRPRKPVPQYSNVSSDPTDAGDGRPQHSIPSVPTRAPPVPPKDGRIGSIRTGYRLSKGHSMNATSSQRSRDSSTTQSAGTRADEEDRQWGWRKNSTAPSRSSMSRKVSATSMKSSFSALPKHMKSTSSRFSVFSFDMIGAAEQEKILEERHRQRQQDKLSGLPSDRRDSRFDEFDEDAFDYDMMDYGDDLEERIPGVNADLDDYGEDFDAANDPDNDQDNFAGFVFQRSDPTSSLTSPHSAGILPTPRDANGHVIGYAETGETPGLEQHIGTCLDLHAEADPKKFHNDESTAGLGIQGLGPVMESPEATIARLHINDKTHLSKDDELYFNDGIHNFDGEGDGSAFDESIFDLNDTDQYGRPIPGMFPHVLAQRNAALETKKRESDATSGLSDQSAVSRSTAHTSLSADMRLKTVDHQDNADTSHLLQYQAPQQPLPGLGDPGYPGALPSPEALVSHLHMAAASGKFRRDSSPDPLTDSTITSPTALGSSHSHSDAINEYALAEYEQDDFSAIEDYEQDDDPIIAEANASALANDSDGFYAREFGFYSNPNLQSRHAQSSLSEKNLYQYSNGGYFAPSGVARTTSGRVVSREPSLTPITERSEYSNRNSLMSIGWSQGPNNAGAIQSPGLAQLAMMAEDHDMSLSALLKLRNKAWGGSQVSLTSSRDGSPYERNGAISPLNQELGGSGRKNSSFSLYSQESTCAESDTGSPTLTMAIPNVSTNSIPSLAMSPGLTMSPVVAPVFSPLAGPTTFPPLSEVEEPTSPETERRLARVPNENMTPTVGVPSKQRPGGGHRHKGSSDSISYVKEQDGGESRWILERRRTGETGEIEFLEREVVGGGRI